jgi:hypothetical protein
MSTTASETAKKTQSSKHFPYDIRPGTYFGYQHMCYPSFLQEPLFPTI